MRPAPRPPRARGSCSRTVSQNMTSTRAWPCSWCEGQGALQPGSRASTQGFIVSIHHRERFLGSPRGHLGRTTLRVSEQSRPPLGGNILISCWLCSLTAAGRPSSPVCWRELQLQGGWAGLAGGQRKHSRRLALGGRPCGDLGLQPSQTRRARGLQTPRGRGQGAAWGGEGRKGRPCGVQGLRPVPLA